MSEPKRDNFCCIFKYIAFSFGTRSFKLCFMMPAGGVLLVSKEPKTVGVSIPPHPANDSKEVLTSSGLLRRISIADYLFIFIDFFIIVW